MTTCTSSLFRETMGSNSRERDCPIKIGAVVTALGGDGTLMTAAEQTKTGAHVLCTWIEGGRQREDWFRSHELLVLAS